MGKHDPNRLTSYEQIFETVMEQLRRGGFVVSDDMALEAKADGVEITGVIECLGNIYVEIKKYLEIVDEDGPDVFVQTKFYKYSVAIRGVGTVFRYDSPHPTHNRFHHVHRYDILSGDRKGRVEKLPKQDEWPHIDEVVYEACDWYYANRDAADALGRD